MRKGFYTFDITWGKKWFWGRTLDKDIKRVDKYIGTGMRNFKGTVHIKIAEGTTAGDILPMDFPLLVVSSKVLEVWSHYEKFSTYPVVIEGGVSPLEYTGITFLGKGGPFDATASKAVYCKSSKPVGNRAIMNMDGLYFDDSRWDGTDLFTIDEFPCVPIITERVVKDMKEAKVTNCEYTPLEKSCIYKKSKTHN